MSSQIGLIGLAVMGQNLALNIAEKGFTISVYNRSYEKTQVTVSRAQQAGFGERLSGFDELAKFVQSIQRPRNIIILVQAGKPVDDVIASLIPLLEAGDQIIDGGNEWYQNTERRTALVAAHGLLYAGMGVSGGEEGARHGPSLMFGGSREGYDRLASILKPVSAQVDGSACVAYIGVGGAGNFVKMVHNGIEYGDMQLIAEVYDVLKNVAGLNNAELHEVFHSWNQNELKSFLIEITADIFKVVDPESPADKPLYVVDTILDKTGSKGTGKWTVQQAAEFAIAAPTIASSLDARYLSALHSDRQVASAILNGPAVDSLPQGVSREQVILDAKNALYSSKICSYAQGMNLLAKASQANGWNLNLGEIASIWKGGCIIRAQFLDRIKNAYTRDSSLASLLIDPEFAAELNVRQASWRRLVQLAVASGIATPSLFASLAYFDSYRRARLPANLTQAQRDYFGAHTYERIDKAGVFHTEWAASAQSAASSSSS